MLRILLKGNRWKYNTVCAELEKMRGEKLTCQERKTQGHYVHCIAVLLSYTLMDISVQQPCIFKCNKLHLIYLRFFFFFKAV